MGTHIVNVWAVMHNPSKLVSIDTLARIFSVVRACTMYYYGNAHFLRQAVYCFVHGLLQHDANMPGSPSNNSCSWIWTERSGCHD